MAEKKYVLLFCDPGIDDVVAIIYTLMHPQLELVGVVTSYGNVTKSQATANAAYVLHLAEMAHLPIIPAACMSMTEPILLFYPKIHGVDGLGSHKPIPHFPGNIHTFDTIRLLANSYKEKLHIVDLGRLTSLAFALNLYHEEMNQVGGYSMMGGAFFIPGNLTTVAEANIFGDASAAKFVLNHTNQVTIAPLNATNQAVLPTSIINKLANHRLYGPLLKEILAYYGHYYQTEMPGFFGAPLHDVIPLMLLHQPAIAQYVYRDVTVVTEGEAKGMTMIDLRPKSQAGKHRIAMAINEAAFIEEFERIMVPIND